MTKDQKNAEVIIAMQEKIDRLEDVLEKSLNWMEWLRKRFPCECEPNQRCVKCCVADDIIVANQALKD